jgi:hypothetical protein
MRSKVSCCSCRQQWGGTWHCSSNCTLQDSRKCDDCSSSHLEHKDGDVLLGGSTLSEAWGLLGAGESWKGLEVEPETESTMLRIAACTTSRGFRDSSREGARMLPAGVSVAELQLKQAVIVSLVCAPSRMWRVHTHMCACVVRGMCKSSMGGVVVSLTHVCARSDPMLRLVLTSKMT